MVNMTLLIILLCVGIFLAIVGKLIKEKGLGFFLIGLSIIFFIMAGIYYGKASSIGKPLFFKFLPEEKVYEVLHVTHGFIIISQEKDYQILKEKVENARLILVDVSVKLKVGQEFTIKDGKIEVISSTAPTPTESGGL